MRPIVLLPLVLLAACASSRPDVPGAQRALARELMKTHQWDRAFAAANAACQARPGDAEALALRGTIFREQGLTDEAKADLQKAVELDGGLAFAHSALAILLDGQGDGDAALRHHRRAAELEPRSASYLNNLGFSLFVRGRPREAIPVLQEALRSAPTDARVRNNLGFALAASGDFAQAAAQFERGGTPAEAKNNLAYAYERRGHAGQAYDLYRDALRIDPKLGAARENLERLARQLNREPPAAPRGPEEGT